MTRYAAAYLRRSVVSEDRPGDASEAAQTEAVQKMCGVNVTIFKDWGISGLRSDRPEYQRLRSEIAAGRVESCCAYSLSRLGRSAKELLDFVALCQQHNVFIRTTTDNVDTSTAQGRAMLTVMAAFAQLEAELARDRTIAGLHALKAKGHDLRRPGLGFRADHDAKGLRILVSDGSADAVIDCYKEAKTYEGAARLLTERKVPTQYELRKVAQAQERGETYTPKPKVWSTSVVARTLRAHAPELLPSMQPRMSSARHGTGLHGQLFRCPDCDGVLTTNRTKKQLYCSKARRSPHTKSVLSWSKVRDFMEEQSAKYQPEGIVIRGGNNDAERLALTERKERLGQAFADGTLKPEAYARQRDDVNAKLAALASSDQAIAAIVPNPKGVDWSLSDDEVGDQLRLIWSHIELGPDWLPKRAVWRVPEWLHDPAARDKYIAEQDAAVDDAQKGGA